MVETRAARVAGAVRPDPRAGAATETGGDPKQTVRATVRIAPAVLIELIELTVRDLPDVVGFRPWRRVGRVLGRGGAALEGAGAGTDGGGTAYEDGGVRVRVDGDRIDADVSVVAAADANILTLSREIQRRVGVAAGQMLGMRVGEVNVFVAGIGEDDQGQGGNAPR